MVQIGSEKIFAEEVGILDNNSEWLGIPKSHLMECAGYSFSMEIINKYKLDENSKIAIFCGTGNNGGDGFVIARHLSAFNIKTLVVLLGNEEKIRTKEAKLNWNIIANNLMLSVKTVEVKDSTDLSKIAASLKEKNYDLIIDGMLGTGIKGKLREPVSTAIELINALKEQLTKNLKVVAIDVPSGLDPNSGEVHDKAIKADLVITFHRNKKGFEVNSEYIKEIAVKSIGIPHEANIFVGRGDFIPTLKTRKSDFHKGQFGRVLIIGGSKNYSGAPAFSSLTCIGYGCDLVITHVPQVVGDVIRSYSPNLIVRTSTGNWLNMKAFNDIAKLMEWADTILIGPGLGLEEETEELFVKVLKALNSEHSLVLDADALKLIKNHIELVKNKNVILTPHEGEFKIMTGLNLPNHDKIDERGIIIKEWAKQNGVVLLVKGPCDYITDGKRLRINKTGCPEMTIGGTGDVLAGLCTSFLTTGNNAFESACSAAFLNGLLGEYCKKTLGSRFTAMDMIKHINPVIGEIRDFSVL